MFQFAAKKNKNDIVNLFSLCFDEEKDTVKTLLDFFFKQENFIIGTYTMDNALVSMAWLIPATFQGQLCYYVYGVCTRPDFRGKGLSHLLMESLKEYAQKNSASCLFLVPATNELAEFYMRQEYTYFPKSTGSNTDSIFTFSDEITDFVRSHYETEPGTPLCIYPLTDNLHIEAPYFELPIDSPL